MICEKSSSLCAVLRATHCGDVQLNLVKLGFSDNYVITMFTPLLTYALVSKVMRMQKKGDEAAGEMEWRARATPHKGLFPQCHFFFKASFFFYPLTCVPPAARQ